MKKNYKLLMWIFAFVAVSFATFSLINRKGCYRCVSKQGEQKPPSSCNDCVVPASLDSLSSFPMQEGSAISSPSDGKIDDGGQSHMLEMDDSSVSREPDSPLVLSRDDTLIENDPLTKQEAQSVIKQRLDSLSGNIRLIMESAQEEFQDTKFSIKTLVNAKVASDDLSVRTPLPVQSPQEGKPTSLLVSYKEDPLSPTYEVFKVSLSNATDASVLQRHMQGGYPSLRIEPDAVVSVSQVYDVYTEVPRATVSGFLAYNYEAPSALPVNVVVIDTGLDLTHEDIQGNVSINANEIPGDGLDNDGNGLIDDYQGYDFAEGDSDPSDTQGHGSHVSGIIAARTGNNAGIAGSSLHNSIRVCPCKVTPDGAGEGFISAIVQAINYAIEMLPIMNPTQTTHIINISMGTSVPTATLRESIIRAADKNIIIVAAAGNLASSARIYPAAYDDAVSVASVEVNGVKSAFSNYGSTIDIAAVGSNVVSLYPHSLTDGSDDVPYRILNGTSMATPFVAGAMALALTQNTSLTPSQIKGVFYNTVTTGGLGGDTASGNFSLLGNSGMLNIAVALSAVVSNNTDLWNYEEDDVVEGPVEPSTPHPTDDQQDNLRDNISKDNDYYKGVDHPDFNEGYSGRHYMGSFKRFLQDSKDTLLYRGSGDESEGTDEDVDSETINFYRAISWLLKRFI